MSNESPKVKGRRSVSNVIENSSALSTEQQVKDKSVFTMSIKGMPKHLKDDFQKMKDDGHFSESFSAYVRNAVISKIKQDKNEYN